MRINPEHARRACRDFVSKKSDTQDLSIDPHAFTATLEAMSAAIYSKIIRSPKCKLVLTCDF